MLLASAAGRAGENIRQLVRLRGTTLLKDIWTDFTFDLAGAFTVIEVTVRDIFAAIVDSVVGSVLYVLQQVAELTGVGAEAASRMKADYDRRVLEENAARERERGAETIPLTNKPPASPKSVGLVGVGKDARA